MFSLCENISKTLSSQQGSIVKKDLEALL